MAISKNTQDREKQKFVESTVTSGKPVVAVANSDGTPITGTGASANQTQGTAADNAASVGNPVLVAGKYFLAQQTYADGDVADLQMDANGYQKVREQYAPGYEDNTNGVAKVEQRFTGAHVTADTQVKAGAGFLHTLTFAQTDAAPTAGSIIVYDSLTETGTILFSQTFTTDVFKAHSVIIDCTFATGLYVGFTTTADVGCTVSYR